MKYSEHLLYSLKSQMREKQNSKWAESPPNFIVQTIRRALSVHKQASAPIVSRKSGQKGSSGTKRTVRIRKPGEEGTFLMCCLSVWHVVVVVLKL